MVNNSRFGPFGGRAVAALLAVAVAAPMLAQGIASAADNKRPTSASALERNLGNLPVGRVDAGGGPLLYRIPIIWAEGQPDRPLEYVLQLFDGTEAMTNGADMHLETIGSGTIQPGQSVLDVNVDPAALAPFRSKQLRPGLFRFQVTVIDSEYRGIQSFERWHARADDGVARGNSESARALVAGSGRWVAGPVEVQDVDQARGRGRSANDAASAELAVREASLAAEERAYNDEGVAQGLFISRMGAVSAASGIGMLSATPPQCGSQPYMFAMYRYKNDLTTRNLRIADSRTKNNTTVRVALANASNTTTQGVLNTGVSTLTGYKSFTTAASATFDTQPNNQIAEFRMNVRYNYYRMQCPDLNNSNVWYDLPEYEYVPKHWTGGVSKATITSLGWSCSSSYRAQLGATLQVSKGATRTWSAGLTATLGGINAGVKQTYSSTTSYSITYTKDTGTTAWVCGNGADPPYAQRTQEV